MRGLGLSLFVAISLMLAGAHASLTQSREELREEFHQTYPLPATGSVSLENINGAVRVAVWDRNEVRVDAVKRAYTRERLDEAKIEVETGGDVVRIKTEYPDSSTNWTNDGQERYQNPASVDYALTVPRGARLDEIKLINGALDIADVAGDVVASSINGRVTARGLMGEAKLSVINGRLEAIFQKFDETKPVSLNSVNGSVVLTIPSDSNVELRANTVHGGIINDFGLPVRRGDYVGHDLAGVLGRGGARVKLNNVNGSITIKRAADNRPLSPAKNLISETRTEDVDDDHRGAREAKIMERDVKRQVERAMSRSQRDIERATREANRAATREAVRRSIAGVGEGIGEGVGRGIAEGIGEGIGKGIGEAVGKGIAAGGRGDDFRRIERETKSLPVSGVPRLRVETFDGRVTVRAWDKPEVMYTAIKRAADDQELRGVRVRAEQQNNSQITISAEFDKNFSREVTKREGRVVTFNSGASVEFEVYVPRNTTLYVSSGDGRLRVEGVDGEVDLHTGDGPVDVLGGRGRLRVDTGDGQIRIAEYDGTADARTGDGRITLDGRFAQLAARTGDGSISLSLPAGSNVIVETHAETVVNDGLAVAEDPDNTAGRVRRWRVGSGGNLLTLRTGDGQIILRPRR